MRSPYAVHRPVENTYLVRQRDLRRLRELVGVAFAVVVFGGALFAYTWVHVEMMRTGYRIDEQEKELHRFEEIERRLRLRAAAVSHPQSIEARAADKLDMVYPSLDQMLFYDEMAAGTPAPVTPERVP